MISNFFRWAVKENVCAQIQLHINNTKLISETVTYQINAERCSIMNLSYCDP
jgi:hypothetical protein